MKIKRDKLRTKLPFRVKVMKQWNYKKKKWESWEAFYIEFRWYRYWVFRSMEIWNNWPNQA